MCVILTRMVVFFDCAVLVFTSLLFFFRVRAVFITNPRIIALFAVLWLTILGECLAFMVFIFENSTPTSTEAVCVNAGIAPYIAATTITPLINDTLIFLAISWRLFRNSYDPYTLRSGIGPLIFGDHLPVFSKVLFRDGQAYFLLALS